jgi:hypothetical protein
VGHLAHKAFPALTITPTSILDDWPDLGVKKCFVGPPCCALITALYLVIHEAEITSNGMILSNFCVSETRPIRKKSQRTLGQGRKQVHPIGLPAIMDDVQGSTCQVRARNHGSRA